MPEQQARLRARLDAGPLCGDGVCALRGRGGVQILESEFGVRHTIGTVYSVLHRIGCSCLVPRPRHEKNDPKAVQAFEDSAPLVRTVSEAVAPCTAGSSECSSLTKARLGQQGTLTRAWAPRGSRPTAVKQTRYEWVYLYAAV